LRAELGTCRGTITSRLRYVVLIHAAVNVRLLGVAAVDLGGHRLGVHCCILSVGKNLLKVAEMELCEVEDVG